MARTLAQSQSMNILSRLTVIDHSDQTWRMVIEKKNTSFEEFVYPLLAIAFIVNDNMIKEKKGGLFSVFDGHGGEEVANYCVEIIPPVRLLRYACCLIEKLVIQRNV